MTFKLFSKQNILRIVLVLAAFAASIAAVIGGAHVQEGHDIEIGSVSPMRFSAHSQMVNPYRTNENREAALRAAENLVPVLERDPDVQSVVLAEIEGFFETGYLARRGFRESVALYFEAMEALAADAVEAAETFAPGYEGFYEPEPMNVPLTVFDASMLPQFDEDGVPVFPNPLDVTIPIHLNDNLKRLFVEMSDEAFDAMRTEVLTVTRDIMDDGIHVLDIVSLLNVQTAVQARALPADVTQLAFEIVSNYIRPNIFVNEAETELRRAQIASDYQIVYYLQTQLIVDANDIITEEAFMALEQMGLVRTDDALNMPLIWGSVLLVSLIYGMTIAYLYIFFKGNFAGNKDSLLIFTLYMLLLAATWSISAAETVPFVFVPLPVFCMLLVMFFNVRIALATNITATVICAMIFRAPMDFVIYFTLMGINISMIANFTTTRNRIMFAGASSAVLSGLVCLSVAIFFARSLNQDMLVLSAFAAAAGLFAVIISVGTAPFWEFVFGAVTSFRLIELSNPNHPVLRKLAIEAPGTYHHSLIVANLAESAAYEVGANPYLARAGGYYHDIGKVKYPLFFAENQGSENPHDRMTPEESCRVLISHVEYGLELSARYKLPKMIRDMIEQHHGTTMMRYFYHKAKSLAEETGEEVDEANYRYNFTIPTSKESAMIMMADTVEAAVRSKMPTIRTFQEVEELVRKLIKHKVDDGQLLDSGVTLRDIESTTQAFLKVFRAMNHERIVYPTKD